MTGLVNIKSRYVIIKRFDVHIALHVVHVIQVVSVLKGDCKEVELCVLGQRKFAAIELMDGSDTLIIAVRPQDTLIDKKWVVKKEVEGKPTGIMTFVRFN